VPERFIIIAESAGTVPRDSALFLSFFPVLARSTIAATTKAANALNISILDKFSEFSELLFITFLSSAPDFHFANMSNLNNFTQN
jgi:hypothetical protein